MNLDKEYNILLNKNNRQTLKPTTITISPVLLGEIDDKCKDMRFSRGELLSVCFLRAFGIVDDNKPAITAPLKIMVGIYSNEPYTPVYDDEGYDQRGWNAEGFDRSENYNGL